MLPKGWQNYVNGREIVVWGTGKDASEIVTEIYEAGETVSFFVSKDWKERPNYIGKKVHSKDVINKNKHFIIVEMSNSVYAVSRELIIKGFWEKTDFLISGVGVHYLTDIPHSEKNEDWEIDGVFIGKGSYFPGTWKGVWDQIGYIGRYTSVNGSVQIHFNHPMNMLSTSCYHYTNIINCDKSQYLDKKYRFFYPYYDYNRIKIGNDVWIGANVFINSSKVKEIGDGAIIGTGAVVMEDVPPYAIVVGVPGKIKKYRYTPEQIECLLRVKWWDWSDEEINENAELLYNPAMFFERFM